MKLTLFFILICNMAKSQAALLRGPYLQTATSNSIIIRWRTDVATIGLVNYGTSPSFGLHKNEASSTTEHIVTLTGLNPHTKYFYSVGDATNVLQSDTGNYFYTLPIAGTESVYRIAALGDCGNNSVNQLNVKNKLLQFIGSNYLDAWLLMGDNAYNSGTETEFQSNFFNIYKDDLLKKYPLFPSPGNHDYANDNENQISHSVPYFSIFSTPTNGESGGTASGTKSYYSFNIGNIHFLSLDSYGIDNGSRMYDTLGPQAVWVKQDLEANTNKGWIVAYFHHPPYTFGSHNSDTETELVKIRQNFIKILERYNVDLVMSGHSHVYERSSLMAGYYGQNADFDATTYDLSTSKGTYDGPTTCPYVKSNTGTVYLVAGSAGQLGGKQSGFPMKAMQFSNADNGGAILLEVQANRLDVKWICGDGTLRDKFTIMKRVNKNTTLNINQGDVATLTASYIGNYIWSNAGETSRTINLTPTLSGTYKYYVQDEFNCIKDTFTVKVAGVVLPIKLTTFNGVLKNDDEALLNWSSQSEINSATYEIETSTDANAFTKTGTLSSANNSAGSTYSYALKGLKKGYNYFRLRMIDLDGRFTFSETIALFIKNATQKLSVFPNPSKTNFTLTGAAVGSLIILLDKMGKNLLQQMASATGVDQIKTSNLITGTYLLKVVDKSGKFETFKVVKE